MKQVLEFNQVRNKFVLDEVLEEQMLVEEIREFFDANTLAERIDAMVDVDYVYDGTKMKYLYNFTKIPEAIVDIVNDFKVVATNVVLPDLVAMGLDFEQVMNKAWNIVCDCNAQKISKLDENGKVVKQVGLPNATELIAEMLEDARK